MMLAPNMNPIPPPKSALKNMNYKNVEKKIFWNLHSTFQSVTPFIWYSVISIEEYAIFNKMESL